METNEETRQALKELLPLLHLDPDENQELINAMVAERIMGWLDVHQTTLGWWKGYRTEKDKALDAFEYIPPYSTDLDRAYEVVYRMGLGCSNECYSFALFYNPSISSVLRAPTALFALGLHPPRLYHQEDAYWADHSNPATAICLAALKAVEGEKGEDLPEESVDIGPYGLGCGED